MRGTHAAGRTVVALLSLALAGCGPGAGLTPSSGPPTSAPAIGSPVAAATSTASPAPTPLATPEVHGPVTTVEGTSTLVSGDLGTRTTDEDGALHSRGGTFVFEEAMNDPRVSGTHTVTDLGMDYWGSPDGNDGALVQWGAERIENDGGAWVGWGSGIYSTDRGDIVAVWFTGTGGYDGLSYFYLTDSRDHINGVTSLYRVRGQIFPGDPPSR